jgi:indolepyruvate ferredoxin oxidoreductase beta subunit
VDALDIAERLGSPRSANVVVIGALSGYLNLEQDIWEKALRLRIKPQFLDVNLRAFAAGQELAR